MKPKIQERQTVLIVVPELVGDGGTRSNLNLVRELPQFGIATEFFALRRGEQGAVPHEDRPIPVIHGGIRRGRRHLYALSVGATRLVRAARRASLILSGGEVGDALVAAFISGRLTRTPVAAIVRAPPDASLERYVSGWTNQATRWAYPHLDAAVCLNTGLSSAVADMGVPAERIRVIPTGVNIARVRSLAAESQPEWLPEGDFVLGIGRLAPEKGFDLLVRAHARVKEAGLLHKLVIIGDGPERVALERLSEELGVSDSVLLPGFLWNPFPALARASVFCLSSHYEGWGLVVGEALTLGVPVIATDCGGPSEILGNGDYGELIEVESVDALESAVASHLRDPKRLRAKAREGRKNAGSFSISARAGEYASLFRELLSRARVPSPSDLPTG